jgi:hypothetical protein
MPECMLCVEKKAVIEWHQIFHSEWQGTNHGAQPGQAYITATPENITEVEEAVCADRRVTM